MPDETDRQGDSAGELHEQRDARYLRYEVQRVARRVDEAQLRAQGQELSEAHSSPDDQRAQGGEGHDPQSPELYQDHDHHFAERGEGLREVYGGKARDADGADRDERGVQPRDAVLRGDRQLQH
jgi:hypothetical protein